MRIFALLVVTLFAGSWGHGALGASPRPMPDARSVLGRALGVGAGRVEIKVAHRLKNNDQLVRFSVLVPSIFSNAAVAYVGTALLQQGPDGKARSARLGSLNLHGTGIYSGLYQSVRPTPRRVRRVKAAKTPWGTLLK